MFFLDIDCFGTYCTHAQTCENVRAQSATQWTASVHTVHMPKPVTTFVFKVLRNDCFRTYFAHAQTCDYVRVQSATQWTASVHTLHMPKPEKNLLEHSKKNLTTHQKSKMASKHCTVWSANVPVCALYIYIFLIYTMAIVL